MFYSVSFKQIQGLTSTFSNNTFDERYLQGIFFHTQQFISSFTASYIYSYIYSKLSAFNHAFMYKNLCIFIYNNVYLFICLSKRIYSYINVQNFALIRIQSSPHFVGTSLQYVKLNFL